VSTITTAASSLGRGKDAARKVSRRARKLGDQAHEQLHNVTDANLAVNAVYFAHLTSHTLSFQHVVGYGFSVRRRLVSLAANRPELWGRLREFYGYLSPLII